MSVVSDKIEEGLLNELLRTATSFGMLDGTLLSSEDIDYKWKEFAPEYMVDAVKNVNDYPEFAVACAGYAGMAVARWWDEDWGRHHSAKFSFLLGSRGFDNMDDHILVDILGKKTDDMIVKMMECLSQTCWNYIRHSSVEPGTKDAFYALECACRCMFRVGASMELKSLGYRYQAYDMSTGKPVS